MQSNAIAVKDLKQGMRVVEYGYGRRIVSTVLEDAQRVDEDRGAGGRYDGWEVRVQPDGSQEFTYFECIEGSPYGPHIYPWEEGAL